MYARPTDYKKHIKLCNGTINGYLYFYDPEHTLALSGGSVYFHRHLASLKLGRWLSKGEVVHHRNGNKADNRPFNLDVVEAAEHQRVHARKRGWGVRGQVACPICGKSFMQRTVGQKFRSIRCNARNQRRVRRPSKSRLAKEITTHSWLALGRKYGVTDNAVRKWARTYGLID